MYIIVFVYNIMSNITSIYTDIKGTIKMPASSSRSRKRNKGKDRKVKQAFEKED